MAEGRRNLPLEGVPEAAVQWLLKAGLGALLFRTVSEDRRASSSPLYRDLQGADLTARFLASEQHDALLEIADACRDQIPAIGLLKGLALWDRLYPSPHLRPMRDMDLLVRAEDVARLEAVLHDLGYEQEWSLPPSFYVRHHHTAPFRNSRTGEWVEVHVGLFRPESDLGRLPAFQPVVLQRESVPVEFEGRHFTRLSNELHLVHLACHWATSLGVAGCQGTPVALVDAIFLLQQESLDWDRICDWVRGSPACAHLLVMLTYLSRDGLASVPLEALEKLRHGAPAIKGWILPVLHGFIDRYQLEGTPVPSLVDLWRLDMFWRILLWEASWPRKLVQGARALLPHMHRGHAEFDPEE